MHAFVPEVDIARISGVTPRAYMGKPIRGLHGWFLEREMTHWLLVYSSTWLWYMLIKAGAKRLVWRFRLGLHGGSNSNIEFIL